MSRVEVLEQENAKLRQDIVAILTKATNPPLILTDDARAEVATAHAQYQRLFSRLYWRTP